MKTFKLFYLIAFCFVSKALYSQGVSEQLYPGIFSVDTQAIPTDSVIYFMKSNKEFLKWSPSTNQVTFLESYPNVSNFSVKQDSYFFTESGAIFFGSFTSGTFYKYSLSTNTWTQKTPFPGAAGPGEIVFFQNSSAKWAYKTGSNFVYKYSPVSNAWTNLSGVPSGLITCKVVKRIGSTFEFFKSDFSQYFTFDPNSNVFTTNNLYTPNQNPYEIPSTEIRYTFLSDTLYLAPFLSYSNYDHVKEYAISTNHLGQLANKYTQDIFTFQGQLYACSGSSIFKWTRSCTPSNITFTHPTSALPMNNINVSASVSGTIAANNPYSIGFYNETGNILFTPSTNQITLSSIQMPLDTLQLDFEYFNNFCYLDTTIEIYPAFQNGMAGWSTFGIFDDYTMPRKEAIAVALDDFILAGLGKVWSTGSKLKDLYTVSYDNCKIRKIADFPGEALTNPIYLNWNNKAIIASGSTNNGTSNKVWMFDPNDYSWTELPELPENTYEGIGFVENAELYIGLGATSNIYKFNSTSNTWEIFTQYPNGIYKNGATFEWNGNRYIGVGSINNLETKTFTRLDMNDGSFTSLGTPTGAIGKGKMGLYTFQDKIIYGYNSSSNFIYHGSVLDMESYSIIADGLSTGVSSYSTPSYCQKGNELFLLFGAIDNLSNYFINNTSHPYSTGNPNIGLTPLSPVGKLIFKFHSGGCDLLGTHLNAPLSFFNAAAEGANLVSYSGSSSIQEYNVNGISYPLEYESQFNFVPMPPSNDDVILQAINGLEYCSDTFNIHIHPLCAQPRTTIATNLFGSSPVNGATAILLDDALYFGLGFLATGTSSSWWKYDLITNQISSLPAFPLSGYTLPQTFALNGNIYLIGGYTNNFTSPTQLWMLNLQTNQWVEKASLPINNWRFGSVYVLDGKAYIQGGTMNGSPQGNQQIYQYNPTNNSWLLISASSFFSNPTTTIQNEDGVWIIGSTNKRIKKNTLSSPHVFTDCGTSQFSEENYSRKQHYGIKHEDYFFITDGSKLYRANQTNFIFDYLGNIDLGLPTGPNEVHIVDAMFKYQNKIIALVYLENSITGFPINNKIIEIPLDDEDCPYAPSFTCRADLNQDGLVSFLDVLIFSDNFPCNNCSIDIDNNNQVDLYDLIALLEAYGNICGN